MSEIYPETPAAPDNLPRDTSTWLGEAIQAASHAYRVEHGYAFVLLDRMGNVERKSWAAVVRTIDALVGERDMRIEVPKAVGVSPDLRCPACDAHPAEPMPAKVIVVTEEGGKERRYAADGFELGLFGMSVTSGGKQVARYVSGTYRFAREEGATLPDTAERQALQDIIRLVDALDEPGPAADMIRLEAMRGLGQQVDAEDECDSAGQNEASESDELRELLAEVLNDASPSPAHAGWIERAQALGVKGWDGDPIGASLSDTIEEQDL